MREGEQNPELVAIETEFELIKDQPGALLLKARDLGQSGKWDAVTRLQELTERYYKKAA